MYGFNFNFNFFFFLPTVPVAIPAVLVSKIIAKLNSLPGGLAVRVYLTLYVFLFFILANTE